MKEKSPSSVLTASAAAALSYRGSSVTNSPHGALASELSLPHAPACATSSAESSIAASGPRGASGPLPSASPFAWDLDSPHTQALVSPVLLAEKKKGGLLSGLKKIFHHSPKAATGAGQSSQCSGIDDAVASSTDGAGCSLEPSVYGGGGAMGGSKRGDRSTKSPAVMRLQVSSSRDLTLAALLTSPVRGGGGGGGGGSISSGLPGAGCSPGSPAVLSSPMPSMRHDPAPSSPSSANLNLSVADGDVIDGCGGGQRLFPGAAKAGNGNGGGARPLGPPAVGTTTQPAGQLLYGNPAVLSASLSSSHLHGGLGGRSWSHLHLQQQQQQQQLLHHHHHHQHSQQQQQQPPHPPALQKSYSTALPSALSGSSSLASAQSFARGDSLSLGMLLDAGGSGGGGSVEPSAHRIGSSTGGGGGSGRVMLPQIASPRTGAGQQQDVGCYSPSGGGGGISPGSGGGGGRSGACTPTSQSASVPLVPEAPAPTVVVEEESAYGVEEEEEEEDVPGSMLLGMNPAVPMAMRRRRWSLDDYQVIKRMYKGGTSAVYKATCTRSGMTVALKVYFLSKVPINVVHMIRREIELHVPLAHRNIIMLYAAFQDEKHIVLVEEYAARGDLFGIHRTMNCRLSETQTSELILAPFLDALSYLHARGIMHRDIKPENILFTSDWTLKIADFGVSINVQEERAVTRTGTADYMAPEVERCPLKHAPEDNKNNPNLAYTPAIDIWSVGVLAYEMLVGFPPFVANGTGEDAPPGGGARPGGGGGGVAAFLAEQATRKTLRFPASVSAAAKDFIMATLNENPGDRPTAQQLIKHPWLFKLARRMSVNSTSRLSNTNLAGAQPY